ncbi:MAG TPA: 1-acyl-sn-glycerol-3-phosphate acyltransferase [Planktothrix sp.]|jgi:1-acyl-sn-glycerol-3-phosphate acyltransferase
MITFVIVTVFVVVLATWLGLRLRRFFKFWIAEGDKLYNETVNGSGGYVVPPVSARAAGLQHWLGKLACSLVVGPVTYIRNPLIDACQTRLVAAPNHQDERDIVALLAVDARRADGTRRRWRYMSAVEQIKPRWRRWWFAFTGCVAVKRQEQMKAAKALLASVKGLVEDAEADFTIFPHGRLEPRNTLEQDQVHDGYAKIPLKVQEKSNSKFSVVPTYVHYFQKPYGLFALPGLRRLRRHEFEVSTRDLKPSGVRVKSYFYGCVILSGAPIEVDCIPTDAEARKKLINDAWRVMQQYVQAMEIKRGRIVRAPIFF